AQAEAEDHGFEHEAAHEPSHHDADALRRSDVSDEIHVQEEHLYEQEPPARVKADIASDDDGESGDTSVRPERPDQIARHSGAIAANDAVDEPSGVETDKRQRCQ